MGISTSQISLKPPTVGTAYSVALGRRAGSGRDSRSRIRNQFADDQITRSRKLEGQWWGNDGAYFVASFARTSDGSDTPHDGQVWFYNPRREDRHAEDPSSASTRQPDREGTFDGPDNITVSTARRVDPR